MYVIRSRVTNSCKRKSVYLDRSVGVGRLLIERPWHVQLIGVFRNQRSRDFLPITSMEKVFEQNSYFAQLGTSRVFWRVVEFAIYSQTTTKTTTMIKIWLIHEKGIRRVQVKLRGEKSETWSAIGLSSTSFLQIRSPSSPVFSNWDNDTHLREIISRFSLHLLFYFCVPRHFVDVRPELPTVQRNGSTVITKILIES